jgi:hypothetical protein
LSLTGGTGAGGGDTPATYIVAGSKTLSDTLTQIRFATSNGTAFQSGGTINIMYEG